MSLADLVQRKPGPSPSLGPDCTRHPLQLASQCRECRHETQLLWGARQLVQKRTTERYKRVEQGMDQHRDSIARDEAVIKARMAEQYLQSQEVEMQAHNEAMQPYFEKVSDEVDEQMLAEAIAELQGKQ